MTEPITILREDSNHLVVSKPAALFSQAASGVDSLETRLASQLKQRDNHPGNPFIGLPHRLDFGTSGAMLIARNQRALKKLCEQFRVRKVGKFYLAWVEEDVEFEAAQRWVDWIRKIPDEPKAEVVDENAAGAKRAELTVCSCVRFESGSCLLIELHTGRMHQIRVQAASRGLHVVGDLPYGSASALGSHNKPSQHPMVALHAISISYFHPKTAKSERIVAPLPDHWQFSPSQLEQIKTMVKEADLR